MSRIIRKSQRGFIVTIELLLLATILVIGLIVGMVSLRDSVLAELSDVSEAIGALNQSYDILGVNNSANTASTAGSQWQDNQDTSDGSALIDNEAALGDAGTGDLDFASVSAEDSIPSL